ncbi:MAG: glycosyltransferase family 4 protein [Roseimicrobium sp.]
MRILNVSNLYPPHYIGGYELICYMATQELRARGHEVRVLTSDHAVAGSEPTSELGIERTLRIHGYFGHPWLGIRDLAKLELHNNAALRRAVAEFQPDVVYVWNLGGISKSLLHTLDRLGVPVAFYLSDHWIARSLDADVWLDWWNRRAMSLPARILRFLWQATGTRRRFDAIAPTVPARSATFRRISFCSQALKQLTLRKGFAVGHAQVIHCPVNIARFRGEPAGAEQPVRRLLYVGRLSEDKGVMTALRALALLQGRFDGELRIYGKGDEAYTRSLQAFVNEHALPVSFHSATMAEMPEVYRSHDALIFTSEWEEPFALTPLEAMASGLPVIGTTTGGSAELFRHGANALTYAAGNAEALADCIDQLVNQPAQREAMARQGQRDVSARCSENIIVDQIEQFLSDTITSWPTTVSDESRAHYLAKLQFQPAIA